ncbi:FCD domain-containing protein [Streptomyces scopuliridis]
MGWLFPRDRGRGGAPAIITGRRGARLARAAEHRSTDGCLLTRQNERWSELLDEHRALYEAIASGDPDRARVGALAHVRANHRTILDLLFGEDATRPGEARRGDG